MSQPRLLVLSEQYRGTAFQLTEDSYTVGRSEASTLRIPDTTISGRHCTISKNADGSYSVKDEGSTNGTSVNNAPLAEEPVKLKNGDVLMLGSIEVLYEDKKADSESKEPVRPIEMRTNPVINISDDAKADMTTRKLENLGSRTGIKRSKSIRDNKAQAAIVYAIVAVVGLAAVAVIAWVFLRQGT